MRKNKIWIEMTNQKGFLMFGDLSRHQKERGVNISNNEVDIICDNCSHKSRFTKKELENKEKVWDWGKWRVFLRGNQVSKSDIVYYGKFKIEFFCSHCQDNLSPNEPKVKY